MLEEIDKDAQVLANTKAGWVNRRDAAERLGETAERALKALRAHRADPDVDVRPTIEKALARAAAGLMGPSKCTLRDLANACSKPPARTVIARNDGYEIDVLIKNGRRQKVYVIPYTRKDGVEIVRVFTRCCKAAPESIEWALKLNMQLTRGTLALDGGGDDAFLVLVDSYPMDEATPEIIKESVKETAFYGDWVESKLTGTDTL